MNKKLIIILISVLVVGAGLYLVGDYLGWWMPRVMEKGKVVVVDNGRQESDLTEAVTENLDVDQGEVAVVEYRVEEVARGLFVPWSIVFTSAERMLVTERDGKVRQVINDVLQDAPLHVFSEVSALEEEGLMGMTLDPDYENNRFIYFCLAYPRGDEYVDKVVRWRDNIDSLGEETILIDDIPAAVYHAGCRVKFGPDQKLYITTGDATERYLAQDMNSLAGKILRINSDGSIPADNPFFGSPVWTLGHRNSQGIAWTKEGVMYETEHGPSGFDGPGGGDEINIIQAGQNYGWPFVSHEQSQEGLESPKLVFTPAEAPADIIYYNSDVILQFNGNLFFGVLKGEGIIRIVLDPSDATNILEYEKMATVNVGRVREVALGPEGAIYFTTSNRDGRGTLREGDDRIYRIITN
ncbi:MAG: PQQ-dependent sugar dehydrogenase [Patescibacteria group bacterium]